MRRPPLAPKIRTEDPDSVLWPVVGKYRARLESGRFEFGRIRIYIATVLHFGDWLHAEGISISSISEVTLQRSLLDHLPHCQCRRPIPRGFFASRAALHHLLAVLREASIIGRPAPEAFDTELESST